MAFRTFQNVRRHLSEAELDSIKAIYTEEVKVVGQHSSEQLTALAFVANDEARRTGVPKADHKWLVLFGRTPDGYDEELTLVQAGDNPWRAACHATNPQGMEAALPTLDQLIEDGHKIRSVNEPSTMSQSLIYVASGGVSLGIGLIAEASTQNLGLSAAVFLTSLAISSVLMDRSLREWLVDNLVSTFTSKVRP